MRSKITVQDWSKNERKGKWAVHYRDEFNKRRRKFFPSKKAAEAEAATMRSQQAAAGEVWLTLPAAERQRLMQIHDEAKRLGVDLADMLAEWKRSPRFTG